MRRSTRSNRFCNFPKWTNIPDHFLHYYCAKMREEAGFELLCLALSFSFSMQLFLSLFMWTTSSSATMTVSQEGTENVLTARAGLLFHCPVSLLVTTDFKKARQHFQSSQAFMLRPTMIFETIICDNVTVAYLLWELSCMCHIKPREGLMARTSWWLKHAGGGGCGGVLIFTPGRQ